jgi:hypothetical protein
MYLEYWKFNILFIDNLINRLNLYHLIVSFFALIADILKNQFI